MELFIGTFGLSHELHNKVQPIQAPDWKEAVKLMNEKHGSNWAFMYNEKLYENTEKKRLSLLKKEQKNLV